MRSMLYLSEVSNWTFLQLPFLIKCVTTNLNLIVRILVSPSSNYVATLGLSISRFVSLDVGNCSIAEIKIPQGYLLHIPYWNTLCQTYYLLSWQNVFCHSWTVTDSNSKQSAPGIVDYPWPDKRKMRAFHSTEAPPLWRGYCAWHYSQGSQRVNPVLKGSKCTAFEIGL